MTPKDLFIKDKELCKWWGEISTSDNFGKVIVYARAQMFDEKCSSEELAGANKFIAALNRLDEAPATKPQFPSSGINHNLDVPRRTAQSKKE
jgi:hypothetical protein